MGKLGKKGRKFAKKHLQSVLKNRRKFKAMRDSFKRKSTRREGYGDKVEMKVSTSNASEGNFEGVISNGDVEDSFLDAIFSEDDNESHEVDSDSDGFLSEDSNTAFVVEGENENVSEASAEKNDYDASVGNNEGIQLELIKQSKKLEKLRAKDPEFSKFLESHGMDIGRFRSEEIFSDEDDELSEPRSASLDNGLDFHECRVLTLPTIHAWCRSAIEAQNTLVLPSLLNGFRSACLYGTDKDLHENSCWRIEKKEVFCKIFMFMLQEASDIFRRLLGISSSSIKKEALSNLKNTEKWRTTKPLLKSFLRSVLYLLDQITEDQILVFVLSRIRNSVIFFADLPTLLQRLIKVVVRLWASGEGIVSSYAFLLLRDIVINLDLKCLDSCFKETYKAFIAQCFFVESANPNHIEFLKESVVELYSLDIQRAYQIAQLSVQRLAKILQQALKTKEEDFLKKICNFQFINCLDLWVKFISANFRDHDLQYLLYSVIQLLSGVAHLFSGPRYLPLRLKCMEMLNMLSSSTGVFIPVASLALSALDYGESCKFNPLDNKNLNLSSLLKVPKSFLKSRYFHEECVLFAMSLLSAHFAQWSYHISFPELATIPLIRLRLFYKKTTTENLKRLIKRLIDQVEQNVDFVQRRRDEVLFSPKDQEPIESFLVIEKGVGNAPFSQFYASILQKKFALKSLP